MLLHRADRQADLIGRGGDDAGELARADPHRFEPVEADEPRRGIDGVHDIVEGARQIEDVLAIQRRDERPIEPLDDLVGQLVALVLGFLDLVGFLPGRVLGGEHVLEQPRAALQLVGQRLEVGVELFFSGNQPKVHGAQDCSRSFPVALLRRRYM